MNEKTIIEINGIKMEIDTRYAKRIDTMCVGDRVKVLIKEYSGYAVHSGTVIGFEPFNILPTIIVAYLEKGYSSVGVKFLYFNAQTKETEIVKAIDDDCLEVDKAGVLQMFERDIQKKQDELEDLHAKKKYFLENFRAYWPQMEAVEKE